MKEYLAVKYYGHYICAYTINANDEKEAYEKATSGKPILQTTSKNFYGIGGFATQINDSVTVETKMEWLIEAIELGYPATDMQHMLVYGLPFVIPGASALQNV